MGPKPEQMLGTVLIILAAGYIPSILLVAKETPGKPALAFAGST
ncbi:hypothetical protein HRbin36_02311 [bacterium HR36]|nr:hypothetical protein HRbin36_02311 [bacterium HR36]